MISATAPQTAHVIVLRNSRVLSLPIVLGIDEAVTIGIM